MASMEAMIGRRNIPGKNSGSDGESGHEGCPTERPSVRTEALVTLRNGADQAYQMRTVVRGMQAMLEPYCDNGREDDSPRVPMDRTLSLKWTMIALGKALDELSDGLTTAKRNLFELVQDADAKLPAKPGMRVSAGQDSNEGVILSATKHGCFFRSDKTGEIFGTTWDEVLVFGDSLVAAAAGDTE